MQVDGPTYERYKKSAPELLDAVSGDNEDNYIMRRDSKTDYCVKFEGGLCGIQRKYGETFLGDACHLYPRVTRGVGETSFMTATLSCPEIARQALFHDDAFTLEDATVERLPVSLHDYLPEGLTHAQAMDIHAQFLKLALDTSHSPARNLMHIYIVAQSLDKIAVGSWAEAAPFYITQAAARLTAAEVRPTDPFFLLQALCGIVAAAKKVHLPRLMQTIDDMKAALHVTIPWDTLTINPMPDSMNAAQALEQRWKNEWQELLNPVLRHYLAAQLSLALFPFAGLGTTLMDRAGIIAIRFATVRLALMGACAFATKPLEEADIIRIIQSLSRVLDHLADAEFSLQIYRETGWLQAPRLRALLGDC
jgi:lysine-N-methylase